MAAFSAFLAFASLALRLFRTHRFHIPSRDARFPSSDSPFRSAFVSPNPLNTALSVASSGRFASGEPKAADLWPVSAHGYLDGVLAGISAVTESAESDWFLQGSQAVSDFVSALAAAEWVVSARDVVDVLDKPHNWNRQFALWRALGSPGPQDTGDDAVVWSVWTWGLDITSGVNIGTVDPLPRSSTSRLLPVQ